MLYLYIFHTMYKFTLYIHFAVMYGIISISSHVMKRSDFCFIFKEKKSLSYIIINVESSIHVKNCFLSLCLPPSRTPPTTLPPIICYFLWFGALPAGLPFLLCGFVQEISSLSSSFLQIDS